MRPWLNKEYSTDGSAGVADAVVIEPLHDGTVFLEVEAVELVLVIASVLGGNGADEVDVLIGVEGGQFLLGGVVLVDICEFQVLSEWEGTMVSKCWSSWYLRTI